MNKQNFCLILLFLLTSLRLPAQFYDINGTTSIPDNGCGSDSVIIEIPVRGVGQLNFAEHKGLVVAFNAVHSFTGDLTATLYSPSGTRVRLVDREGSSGDDFIATNFVYWPAAPTIVGASAPFTGNFQPAESLNTFDGEIADGIWKLVVCDNAGDDVGTLGDVGIRFNDEGGNMMLAAYYTMDNTFLDQGNGGKNFGGFPTLSAQGLGNFTQDLHLQDGSAYEFNGDSYLIATADNPALNPTDAFTVAAWVRVDDAVSDQKIVGKHTESSPGMNTFFGLAIENNQFHFELLMNEAGSNPDRKLNGGVPIVGQWAHLAGTWSQGGEKRLYVNGILVNSEAAVNTPMMDMSDGRLTIGAIAIDPTFFRLDGAVDDIRLYNYELSEVAIRDIAQAKNNYCQTAMELPVDGSECSLTRQGHNFAGSSTGLGTSCGLFNGGDQWYTVQVPASGKLDLSALSHPDSEVSDLVLQIYDGSCQDLVEIDCNDDTGLGAMPALSLADIPAGSILYARLFAYNNSEKGFYGLCAFEPASPPTPITDMLAGVELNLFPNPTHNGLATIQYADLPLNSSLRVLDPIGREVLKYALPEAEGQQQLNLAGHAAGIYLLRIETSAGVAIRKLIVR